MKNYKFIRIASNKISISFLILLFAFSFFITSGFLFADFGSEPDKVKTHIIKENDTLANISYIYYNNDDRNRGAHWFHIYEYNVIKGYINPDKQPVRKYGKINAFVKIYVGKKLLIPIYNNTEYPSIGKLFEKYGFGDIASSYAYDDKTIEEDETREAIVRKEEGKEKDTIEIEYEDMVEIKEDEDDNDDKTEEYLNDLIVDEDDDDDDDDDDKSEEYLNDLIVDEDEDDDEEELITIENTESTVDKEADGTSYPDYDSTINWTGLFRVDYDDLKNKLIEKQGELNTQTQKLLSAMEDYQIDLDKENMRVTIYQDGEITREGIIEDNKDSTLDLVFDGATNNIRVSIKKDENDFLYLETAFTFTTIILFAQ